MEVLFVGGTKESTTYFPVHSHGYWEIQVNISGHGTMTIDSQNIQFHPGQIFIIPPDTLHGKESGDGFWDLCMTVKDMRPIGDMNFKIFEDDDSGNIAKLMEIALDVYENKSSVSAERVGVILNALAESIYQILSALFSSRRQKNLRIDRFIERMEANISNPGFELSEEVEKYGYNPVYFREMFKKATGKTPVSYFNQMRIDYAKKLFHHYGTSRTIKDIGLACGFTDPYYFSRVFKKVTGMSPSTFLEQIGTYDLDRLEKRKDSDELSGLLQPIWHLKRTDSKG